ncbi:glycosyltransferase family 4 protein [Pedobacter miscanthi]|nr:glycosyltransferase family 4 protein [Pedobacter miscanthi]
MKKLAIIISHPIQYYAPVFKLLAQQCELKVFYTLGTTENINYDPGFKQNVIWDIDLLEGYDHEFIENTAKKPGSQNFMGIKNPKIIKLIKAFSPDALLVYGWSYFSHLSIIWHFKGKIPVWFRGDSTLIDNQPWIKRKIRKAILTLVYKNIDIAFYVGKANKAYFKTFGLKENKLIFVPHAVDNIRFGTDRKNEALTIRNKLGINLDETLILFAGKLESKKSPDLLLEAFKQLNRKDVHLLFVGNGELEKPLKSTASDQKIRNVHFLDFQNQTKMPAIYQACNLYCLPSRGPGETWGLAVNEAMAAGKAILISDKVGCAIDLVDASNGLIFDINEQSLLSSLQVLINNDLKVMGEISGKKIENWNFNNQVAVLVNMLNG